MTEAPDSGSPGLWQPYVDEPLLTPAMTDGYDAVPAAELERLRHYLEGLSALRRAPVHVSVAFNATYFGYDLGGEGYGSSPLDLDAFPIVSFGGRSPALPVGAMVHIATGAQPLYAEIVYKEGRHPGVSSLGDVPAWISGAPAGASGPGLLNVHEDDPVRRELLIPDFHAFGSALSPSPAQLNRLRDQARWLDRQGHLLVDAVHPSHEAARADDGATYADYLLTAAREQFLSPLVPVPLTDLTGGKEEHVLRGALSRLLAVIRRVLVSSDKLRMWRSYAMTCEALAQCWKDRGPLGGDDMGTLAAALQRAAKPVTKRRHGMPSTTTVYTAVGPRLYDFPEADPLLTGVGYAAAVCRANLALADVLRGESENGFFADGTRVTLDDAFEGGGVWRSCHPATHEPMSDPLTPAGLGWRTSVQPAAPPRGSSAMPGAAEEKRHEPAEQVAGAMDVPHLEPVDQPLDDAGLVTGQLLRISDSEVAWRMSLRLTHLMDCSFPLRPIVADELRGLSGQSPVRLELAHPGGELDESEAVQDILFDDAGGTGRLLGVEWPLDFFPGLELRFQWPRGGRVIRATTSLLEVPMVVDGRTISHRYDAGVLTREDVPGSTRTHDSPTGLGPEQLVMRVVRRCGLLTLDGHALLDRTALPVAVYGRPPAASQTTGLEAAVVQLLTKGELYSAVGSHDADGHLHFPAWEGEPRIPLVGYTPNPMPVEHRAPTGDVMRRQALPTPVTPYCVFGHLRRLQPGKSPSEAQRAAFREHCRRLGKADGWELPPGYTFVTQHTRSR
ncbi:hypothetical protein [Streptomyces sp. UNOC14_S4]|uniref:hypothetical protein n=1 Tax=Streptomyces sp. UNOC14_S4 TaxID=2872340 RepID=UPI001E53F4BE|nr:hypothetical protein [Streptomyces sp. UNOC14_S4]MCC3769570.1 hypothetical protein [Streptomyces sp. UNOC14_S4]